MLRNTKNEVLTNQKSFVRYRASSFGLERNERRRVLGICKEWIKTAVERLKKATYSSGYFPPGLIFAVLKWELISVFPFPGTMNITGEGSKKILNSYLLSWHTEGI